jgi:hypothetical protein
VPGISEVIYDSVRRNDCGGLIGRREARLDRIFLQQIGVVTFGHVRVRPQAALEIVASDLAE